VIPGRQAAWRYGWIVLLLAGYAALVHYSNSHSGAKPLGAVLAVAPLLAIGLGVAWRSTYRLTAVALALLAGSLAFSRWKILESNYSLLYLLEDLTLYGLLSVTFARSLAKNRMPLCSYWATLVHGPLPPLVARYTRTVTTAWAVFFALIGATSVTLYAWASLPAWSAFANFVTLPLVGLMFLSEYAVRRKTLPPSHRTGLLRSVQVFLDASRAAPMVRQ
jgi:uncharacterized membrane protein